MTNWIKAEDRLPKTHNPILIHLNFFGKNKTNFVRVTVGFFRNNSWRDRDGSEIDRSEVDYWAEISVPEEG